MTRTIENVSLLNVRSTCFPFITSFCITIAFCFFSPTCSLTLNAGYQTQGFIYVRQTLSQRAKP